MEIFIIITSLVGQDYYDGKLVSTIL